MVASFASLPAELVGRVAGIVHEQDRAWAALDVQQGDPYRAADDEDYAPGVEDVPLGRWSPEYGHGIRALNITARAAAAPYFRIKVLGQDLGHLVHELGCRVVTDDDAVSLACALEGLPNLSSIIISGDNLHMLQQGGVDSAQELIVQAMKSALGRITSLVFGHVWAPGGALALAHALEHVNKRRLRHLVVTHSESIMPIAQELVAVLQGLDGLVDVELDASDEEHVAEMQRRLRFPHVRTLKLFCSVTFLQSSPGLFFPSSASSASTSAARPTSTASTSTAFPRSSTSPSRASRAAANVFPDSASLSTLPPTLRAITFGNTLTVPPSPSASLVAKFDELGIRIRTPWSPPPLYVARRWAEDSVPTLGAAFEAPGEDDAVDLQRLFDWASARAGWLMRIGDGRALEELAAAALRVRRRFVIEHS
ncbi:hypothetical protein JCM9279_003354 [Rhodotorula babjevae]